MVSSWLGRERKWQAALIAACAVITVQWLSCSEQSERIASVEASLSESVASAADLRAKLAAAEEATRRAERTAEQARGEAERASSENRILRVALDTANRRAQPKAHAAPVRGEQDMPAAGAVCVQMLPDGQCATWAMPQQVPLSSQVGLTPSALDFLNGR